MSDEIRVNRPAPAGARPEVSSYQEAPARKSSKTPWIILAVVVVLLVVAAVLFRDKLFTKKDAGVAAKSSGYQAVFLTNGQVYFGKISGADNDYLTLKDIYYLQVVQPPLQGQQQPDQQQQQAQAQPQVSLVKLGQELHGPVDEMHISKAQVLFYEDLKTDGKVVEAIKSYQANPQGQK